MTAYYNEIDPYAAAWLRNLIAAGHIADGEVDERDIREVAPADLHGFAQCHFFAGIGGWSYAARLAGWPDERPLWTGSCPCQPYSVAGKGEGQADPRHLWPEFFRLIGACRPDVVMGEQVAAAVGKHWLDGVHSDLESIGYACGAAVVPACAVNAPHRRDRLWFVADPEGRRFWSRLCNGDEARNGDRQSSNDGRESILANTKRDGWGAQRHDDASDDRPKPTPTDEVALADADQSGESQGWEQRGRQFGWSGIHSINSAWLVGADGKARRVEPSIRLLAHGVPARVGKLRAYGNAIVPPLAAEVIGAYLETERLAA